VNRGLQTYGLATQPAPSISGGADEYYASTWDYRTRYEIDPANIVNRTKWLSYDRGIAVGLDEVLPLGDNRDNSRDGRYFGPVKLAKVLGRGLFKYWPLTRIGGIH
jgi:signal peptidase I